MKGYLVLPSMIMLFLSCSSSAPSRVSVDERNISRIPQNSSLPDEQAGYFISKPQDGSLIITGVSNWQRWPGEELENALDDAARKVALYHGLKGKFKTVLITGAGFRDFYFRCARFKTTAFRRSALSLTGKGKAATMKAEAKEWENMRGEVIQYTM